MLFCDLSINGIDIWDGVPCLTGVDIVTGPYLGFLGHLIFLDMMGGTDPVYTSLSSRYALIYTPVDGSANVVVPLQDIPSQQLSIILGGQNCVLSFYDRDVSAMINTSPSWVVPEWVAPGWTA